MRSYIITAILLSILFLTNCSKEPEVVVVVEDPIIQVEPDECVSISCDTLNQLFDTEDCQSVYFGRLKLSENALNSFHEFKFVLNDTISYTNDSNTVKYIVTHKFENDFGLFNRRSSFDCPCVRSNNNNYFYCSYGHSGSIDMESMSDSTRLNFKLSTTPDTKAKSLDQFGDRFAIYRNNFCEFEVIIDKGTLSFSTTSRQEFYSSIQLGEFFFDNVISYNIENINRPRYKFYYTSSNGLVAYEDTLSNLWIKEM